MVGLRTLGRGTMRSLHNLAENADFDLGDDEDVDHDCV